LLNNPNFNISINDLIYINQVEISQGKISKYPDVLQKISNSQNADYNFLEYTRFPKFRMYNGLAYLKENNKLIIEDKNVSFNYQNKLSIEGVNYQYPEFVDILSDNEILLTYESDDKKELLFVILNTSKEYRNIFTLKKNSFFGFAKYENKIILMYKKNRFICFKEI